MRTIPCLPSPRRPWTLLLVLWLTGLSIGSAADVTTGAAVAEERIAGLRRAIAHHDDLYFRHAAPEITDAAYDELKRELDRWTTLYPEFAGSPEPTVGDDRTGARPTVAHTVPMLSLNKSYEAVELREFCDRTARRLGRPDLAWVLEPKFDGIAVSVVYDHGRLSLASTRGNGAEGDDVTPWVRAIPGLPAALPVRDAAGRPLAVPDQVELRGEIFLSHAELKRLNAERAAAGLEPYAHPRNVAAGTLQQDDPEEVRRRGLAIVFYGRGEWSPGLTVPTTQMDLHAWLAARGLPHVTAIRLARGFDEIWAAVTEFGRLRSRWPFPVDGVVLKVNDTADQEKLGNGPAAPEWAMAFKFPPERRFTRLRRIALQVGRSGVVTPVAEFDPVRLGGTRVTRASLHNASRVARLDLHAGDWVEVEKAGEVIPQLVAVDASRREPGAVRFVLPEDCPVCGARLVADAARLRCPNAACPAQVRRRLELFASAEAAGIRGLGPVQIDQLLRTRLVRTPADFYRLDAAGLSALMSPRAAARLLDAIAESRRAPLWRIIVGLGIPGVGPAAARALAERFPALGPLAATRREALLSADGKSALAGVSTPAAVALWAFLGDEEHRQLLIALDAARATGN